jgi:ABC-type phosphate transport system substrate-binding protein
MHRTHTLRTLAFVAAAAAALVTLTAGQALADPPPGVTPRVIDVVGTGADTTQFLYDQLSHDYRYSYYPALYSWDAVPAGGMITPKAGCTPIARPDGSAAGVAALAGSQTISAGTGWCVDYARSSRGPSAGSVCESGGFCFIKLAGEAVTWASRSAAAGGTDAPANLTVAQLVSIYECTVTNWSQVGGANAPIHAFLPQTASDTRAFFLTALGGGTNPITPGPCVSDSGNTLADNQGVAPELNDPDAIVPYSVADFIAQVYHSAPCTNGSDCGYPAAPACTPAGQENLFGCDLHGVLTINEIAGTKPVTPWPPPAAPTPPAVNRKVKVSPHFDAVFTRTLYTVVRYGGPGGPGDDIPDYLRPFFDTAANNGWVCGNTTAQTDIQAYGFFTIGAACGTPHLP